jgi:hypothetical protein
MKTYKKRLIIGAISIVLLGAYVFGAIKYGPHNLWIPAQPAAVIVTPLPTLAPEPTDAPAVDNYSPPAPTPAPTPVVCQYYYTNASGQTVSECAQGTNIPVDRSN